MASADWYFDFVSPFSYLQCEQLPQLERSIRVRYRPVLFAGLLKASGHKGPAEIPAKRRFTYQFVAWQAKRLGVPLKFPAVHPFNPLPLLRLAVAADADPEVIRRIFRFVWRDGRLGDLPIEWAELMTEIDMPDAAARIESPEVKEALRRNTDEAIARGVFGVPTLKLGATGVFPRRNATATRPRQAIPRTNGAEESRNVARRFRPAAARSARHLRSDSS